MSVDIRVVKFVKLSAAEAQALTEDNFNDLLEDGYSSLRWNNDNTETFVQYTGVKPSFLTGSVVYYDAMWAELSNPASPWFDSGPDY